MGGQRETFTSCSSKQKIVIIHEDGRITGGSSKIAVETAIGLAEKGYDVTYFCGTYPVDEKLQSSVNKIVCLNQKDIASDCSKYRAVRNGIWNREAYDSLSKLLKEYGSTTLVHIHGWSHVLSSSIFKACIHNHITPYVTLHDYFAVCPNGGLYNYQKNCICRLTPMSLQCIKCNCDSRSYKHKLFRIIRQVMQDKYVRNNQNIKYIYISKFSLSKMQRLLESQYFYYLHNPIDGYEIDRIDAIHNDRYLFIGRISPEKGADIFCKAIHQLNLKGVVIGDGLLKEKLSKEYPDIEFVGWKTKKEIVPYIKQARCLIFPSKWYEGAPLTTEECLNVGIPCIVSNECAAVDQINEGVNGYIFKSEDVNDLIKCINKIHYLEWDQFDMNKSKYTMNEYLDELIKIYKTNF